jgi:exopolysaccharide biosynthesis polyprenyl glycosylphosphotransferase
LLIGRAVTVPLANALRKNRSGGHRIVVVGSGARGVEFAGSLQRQHAHNVELLGFVSVPGEPNHVEARPNLGYVGSLAALLDRLPVDEVVFVVEGRHPDIFKEAIAACDARGVDVLLTLPPEYSTEAKLEIASVSGFDFPLLGLRRTPTGELELAVKRVMDFLGGTFGCVLAAPIMLLAAIAIKLESPGPVLFRQVRAGRNGRKFVMYKFRSMVIDAESQKATLMHLNEMGGPVFKIRQDPRITRVGRIIRKTSIDELPQFFNIIKGDMSMVGPRPPLPSEVEEYKPWQRRRLSVKPGLTGLWQVSGRNQVDFDEWMQLDLQYIDNWSLWLDIKILFQTIPVVLLHKGAS